MTYLCVIPARGGSKGLPGKNLRDLHGKPLLAWTIEHALASERRDRVVVSTDDERIADAARARGAEVPFLRPSHLAEDDTPTEPVLLHAVEELGTAGYRADALVLLQPTSPLRRPGALDAAIGQFESEGADSLVSVSPVHWFLWRDNGTPEPLYDFANRPRRQELARESQLYMENGSIYIVRTETLVNERNRIGGKVSLFLMSGEEGHDIDSLADFLVVEALMQHGALA